MPDDNSPIYDASMLKKMVPILHKPTIHYDYVVLGFLDEYMGGRVQNKNGIVERFYPAEGEIATLFETHLNALAQVQQIDTTITKVIDERGFVTIYSDQMEEYVDTLYKTPRYGDITRAPEQFLAYSTYSINTSMFPPANGRHFSTQGYDERFSYLLGAYQRYGKENKIILANATEKASLIATFLREIRSPKVTWTSYLRGVPGSHHIEFEPTMELRWLFWNEETTNLEQ